MDINLPISKSIANRLLILQALHGDGLLSVSAANTPDDVRLLHSVLCDMPTLSKGQEVCLYNCGTAMRFLTAYCAQMEGCDVVLTGTERMKQRPVGQLVTALRELGADIEYMGEEGFPPLHIRGRMLPRRAVHIENPLSTQFVSALLLIGVPATTNVSSPYIYMTQRIWEEYAHSHSCEIESDWSAAAFWYEYIALHCGTLFLRGLQRYSLQGDRAVADLFVRFGVLTSYQSEGIVLTKTTEPVPLPPEIPFDFSHCPDLYPAVAITCERLGVRLAATGTKSLTIKESDRLKAIAEHRVCADHRIAMALLAADLPCDDRECISKSYPDFYSQLCKLKESYHGEA